MPSGYKNIPTIAANENKIGPLLTRGAGLLKIMISLSRHCAASSANALVRHWRLTPDWLIEEGPEETRVFGRWDKIFGCWHLDKTTGLQRLIPTDICFDHLGRWREMPEDILRTAPNDNSWHHSRAARAAYFSLIPTRFRRLVGRAKENSWAALEYLWINPNHAPSLEKRINAYPFNIAD